MASWSDNSPIQFNPYIQQLPIEAMLAVGTEKQRRYDVGVEKIQSAIDNVAGLEIIRDVDKSYLQKRLSDLNGTLRGVAAGDFSNYQLVNSVSGTVEKIAKDEKIQNAVSSTKAYKRGLEEMRQAIKEGKSNPSNEYMFKLRANKWLSSGDINEQFNDSYTPYTDYKKHAIEVIKALTKSEDITDDSFELNADGTIKSIKDVNVRTKLAGVSADQINQALMVGLSASDFKQMEMDGIYHYANASPEEFLSDIATNHSKMIKSYTDKKTNLQNSITKTTSVPEKQRIEGQIAEIDKAISKVDSDYSDILNIAKDKGADSAKAQLFTSNFLHNFGETFSFTEASRTYTESIPAKIEMDREQNRIKNDQWERKFDQDERFKAIDIGIEQAKLEAQKKEGAGGELGGLPMSTPEGQVKSTTITGYLGKVGSLRTEIKTDEDRFLGQMYKSKRWLIEQKDAWLKSPNAVDGSVNAYFMQQAEKERTLASYEKTFHDVVVEADKQFGDVKNEDKKILEQKTKFMQDELAKRTTAYSPVSYTLSIAKPEQKNELIGLLMKVDELATKFKGEMANSPDFDINKLRKVITEPNGATLTVVEGTYEQPKMYNLTVNGKEATTSINLTPEQKVAVFGYRAFEATPEEAELRPYSEQIRRTGRNSTAPNAGRTSVTNSYLNKIDFPSVSIYGVTGNIETFDDGQTYSLRLNIYDPVQKKWIEDIEAIPNTLIPRNKLAEGMRKLDDVAIYRRLHDGKSPTQEDINKIKAASQIP